MPDTKIHLYQHDLPKGLDLGKCVAIDTETMGLNPQRDRICLVQLSSGDGEAHLVKIAEPKAPSPNLKRLLADTKVEKLFHFARFDLAMLSAHIGEVKGKIYCTKIASRFGRTYTSQHSLKELIREIIGIEISKQQQSSDWGAGDLSEEQLRYAANDVLYLHQIRKTLDEALKREDRKHLAEACFDFLPQVVAMDLKGYPALEIFSH